MTKLLNSVAIVTGANRGIGKALVEALIQRGANKVYACARQADQLLTHSKIEPITLDITDSAQVAALSEITKDANVLINNAGTSGSRSLLADDGRHDMEVNFYGTINVIRQLYTNLEQNGGGRIINVNSICGLASMPAIAGYCASKAALFSATQALRIELKPKNILVHSVFPGPADTDMNKGVDIYKAPTKEVAEAILDGIDQGLEDIYPDSTAKRVFEQWSRDPKALEKEFSSIL